MLHNDTDDQNDQSGLHSRLRTATLALRADNAANRFMLAARRLHDALLELRYRPDQPRVPAGTPEGGQWIDAGGGSVSYVTPSSTAKPAKLPSPAATFPSTTPAKIGLVSNPSGESDPRASEPAAVLQPIAQIIRNPGFYSIDLRAEEFRGPPGNRGHAYSKHVGKTEAELINELNSTYRDLGYVGSTNYVTMHDARGSFLSIGDANYFVSEALRANTAKIEAIVSGTSKEEVIQYRFGYQTGIESYWETLDPPPKIRPTFSVVVVVRPDPSGARGYRIHTAFPANDPETGIRLK